MDYTNDNNNYILLRKKVLFSIGIVAFLIFSLLAVVFYMVFIPHMTIGETQVFKIAIGENLPNIARRLKDQDIIKSERFFNIYAQISNKARDIKAGVYHINSGMNIRELLNVFISGGAKEELTVKILEGWTIKDIARYFEGRGIFARTDFLTAAKENFGEEFNFLNDVPRAEGSRLDTERFYLQGFLFPDTYRVFKDAKPQNIIKKMLGNFDLKFTQAMRDEIILQRKTTHQIIIMASLLEREVRTPEDKAIISGILWKRIQLKIPLQVDATIVFAKTDGFGKLENEQKLYLDDLKIKSAYNTYVNLGLPPGPVASPGLASIEAALYPKSSPYLYYLSASDGKTIFSKTLDEHNRNKAKYLKK